MWQKKLKQQNSITHEFTLTNIILQEKNGPKSFKISIFFFFFGISKFVLQSGETYLFK